MPFMDYPGFVARLAAPRVIKLLSGSFAAPALALGTLSSTAPTRPSCVPRLHSPDSRPASFREQHQVASGEGRMSDITLYSPALTVTTHVMILVPRGYDPSGATRYPVLYLLHGVGGDPRAWTEHGALRAIDGVTARDGLAPFITVMPDGGRYGFYSDWYGTQGNRAPASPPPAWETYHIDELIPWIDSNYPTVASRSGRAVAGLSMGGFGAMSYAGKHPDLFTAAGSFSGAVGINHQYPYANDMIISGAAVGGYSGGRCIWGDPQLQVGLWRAADPTGMAQNLRGMSIYIASGNGKVGPLDNPSNPSVYSTQRVEEEFVWPMNKGFDAALGAAGIAHVTEFYGNGTHDWPYWLRDLRHFLPQMDAAFRHPHLAPPATEFEFRSACPAFSVWDWSFRTHQSAGEFISISGVSSAGFQTAGTGRISVVTPAEFAPGTAATMAVNGRPRTLIADSSGRLAFEVDLRSSSSPPAAGTLPSSPPVNAVGWVFAVIAVLALRWAVRR
jgi:S-formylglutathione hydrolase FrmB